MGPEALPPYRHVSSTLIGHEKAGELLATYIRNSEAHPHLHPDALITPMGVQFGSHGGPSGGVVMHNLRRVAAGLRGEHLEPEPSPEPEDRWGADTSKPRFGTKKKFGEEEEGAGNVGDEEWQDKSEYEREEGGTEVGEIGDRDNFVASGGDVPAVEVTEGADAEKAEVGKKRKTQNEKDARREAKKARNKQFKDKKAIERAKKSQEDAAE